MDSALRFAVLGPVRAWRDGVELDLGPPTQRAMLAVLLARVGQPVSIGELVDVLWGADPPSSAVNIIHRHTGMLRRLFEPDLPTRAAGRWLVRAGGGYLLDADADADTVDLLRFRRLGERARGATAGEPGVRLLAEALGLWQGPAASGVEPHVRSHPIFTALDWEYLAAVRDLADAALDTGLTDPALPTVRLAAAAHPLDESVQARLVLLLAATGNRAEALDTYHAVRVRLAEELGVDPGSELRAAHHRALREDVTEQEHPVAPAQLPADLSTFIGRREEIADALAPLVDARPVSTVVITAIGGMAGIGKTTLAVHWAHQIARRFPDGQLYVNLRGFDPTGTVMSPAEAVRGFLDAFGVPPQRIPAGIDAQAALYRSMLAGRRVLVVLDNARDVDQVRPLLPGSPGCLVIVTSRDRLAGLIAVEGAQSLTLDLFPTDTARAFLVRRLGAERIAAEPPAVDEIVERCAGLPLALAIVAARATAHPRFPLSAIAAELRDAHGSLEAFAGAGAAIDARAVFSWSYRTLSPDAARLFRLLSLHPGATAGAAAAASLAGAPLRQARSTLAELTAAQLITELTPGRYAYHDLLRAYAAELTGEQDTERVRRDAVRRLLDHYVHTAYRATRLLTLVPEPVALDPPAPGVTVEEPATHAQAMGWFEVARPGLPGVVDLATETGLDAHVWHLAWVGRHFLEMQGHWRDWLTIQHAALAAAEHLANPIARAHSHRLLGLAYNMLERFYEARSHLRHALDLFEALGDVGGQAATHRQVATVLIGQGQLRDALRRTELALDLYRRADDGFGEANALNDLGYLRATLGDHRQGLADCRAALDLVRKHGGHRRSESAIWDSLGYAHRHLGDHRESIACYRRAAELRHAEGDRYPEATTLGRLGDVQHEAGEPEQARAAWRQALSILDALDHPDADAVRAKLTPRALTRP